FRRQKQKGKWDAAEATAAEIEKLLPEAERDDLGVTRFELVLDRKDYQGAYKLAARLGDAHPENAIMQNQMAWEIATREALPNRHLELAEKIVRRANNATQASDAEIVDTLPRVLFLKGDNHAGIELQGQAVNVAAEDRKRHVQ